jgi:hypothetical protein
VSSLAREYAHNRRVSDRGMLLHKCQMGQLCSACANSTCQNHHATMLLLRQLLTQLSSLP